MRVIETFQDKSADFVQTIELDNVIVSLRLVFNTRSETWFINEYIELDTNKKLLGVKLIREYPIFLPLKTHIDLPGDFMLIKEDEDLEEDVTYDNLNNGWNLYYLTAEEILQWKAENGL